MRLLLIGCGSIGVRHIRNLQSFSNVDNVEIIAYDVDPERANQVATEFGLETTVNLEQAFEKKPVAVLICTPTHLHLDLAKRALAAGVHIFIEKPLSHSLLGVPEFVKQAQVSNRIVLVGCNMRFHPPVQQIQTWLDRDLIGRLQFVRLRYGHYLPNWRPTDYRQSYSANENQGGGIILDAVHELDLAYHWVGDVETVYCLADKLSDLEIDVEDTAEILLRSTQRAVAQIHIDYLRPERARTYELIGSKGMIRWMARGKNPERSTVSCYRMESDSWENYDLEADLNAMYINEMRHFLACLAGNEQPLMDAQRGLEILALALRAKLSAKERRELPFSIDSV